MAIAPNEDTDFSEPAMKAAMRRRYGPPSIVALLLCVAMGGCNRSSDTTSNTGNTSGMTGPATGASAASGLTGPAVTPAPAPPQAASD